MAQDHAEADNWHQRAAEQGHRERQYQLARSCLHSRGVEQDYVEAGNYHRRTAEQGHASAQVELGSLYESAGRTSKDRIEAVKWSRRAAEEGDATGQDCSDLYIGLGGTSFEITYKRTNGSICLRHKAIKTRPRIDVRSPKR
ncbi:MAG: sel1 repeat family protein [Pseudomonadota bacterium]|nr:MAG: sel1 repeat family protein [Pseudomonadota bacterium]